jgi:hypothetical protein
MTWSCASEVCVPAWNLVHVATASIYDRSTGNIPSHDRSKVPAAGCRMNTESLQGMGPPEPLETSWQVTWEMKVLPVTNTRITVFGVVTPCSLVDWYRHFIQMYHLHLLRDVRSLLFWKQYIHSWHTSTYLQTTGHDIPEVSKESISVIKVDVYSTEISDK